MDTSIFCVYNLERRVFLSSKVTIVDGVAEPLKALRLLVSGLGANAESGLWLTNLLGMPAVPKLFPYDLACLDNELRVIETIEILPGVEFPQYRRDVSSAVLLPPDTLRTTQTRVGDRLLIATQDQVDQLLADLDATSHPGKVSAVPQTLTMPVEVAAVPATPSEIVVVAGGPTETPASTVKALEPAATAGQAANSAQTPAKPPSSSVAITEAILEKTDSSVGRVPSGAQHRWSVEDLFANWVDSPATPPSWIVQKARESATPGGATETSVTNGTKTPENRDLPPEKSAPRPTEQVRLEMAQSQPSPPAPMASKEPVKPSAPIESPAPVRISQPAQKTTFTVAQYGMWQVSPPSVAGPVQPVRSPAANGTNGQNPAKRDTGWKREDPTKRESGAARKTNGVSRPIFGRAKEGQAVASSPAKPAAPGQEDSTGDSRSVQDAAPSPIPQAKVELPAPATKPAPQPKTIATPVPDSGPEPKAELQSSTGDSEQSPRDNQTTVPGKAAAPAFDFATAVQDKLDRIQLKAQATDAETSPPRQSSPFGKKTSTEQPAAAAQSQPPVSIVPPRPLANAEARKTAEPQRGTPIAPPGTRPLKPKPVPNGKPKIADAAGNGHPKKEPDSLGLGAKFKRWLSPAPSKASDRRRAHRRYVPGVEAHYFTGGAPKPHYVADISMTGIYVETDDRWLPDTMIRMTLQKPCARGNRKQSITVLSRIVRRGSDGIAAEFVMEESLNPSSRDVLPSHATDRFALARFL